MPSITENIENWRSRWDWSQRGDEWSKWWGDTSAMWFGALLPRVHALVLAPTILEIAPGYGRWTQYLKDLCDQLVIVDLTEDCIAHCEERFADATNISYFVNDGRSLSMVADRSVDFVFSFDSLVHVEPEVISGYLLELSSKLSDDGIGFIHHSNAGGLKTVNALSRRIPGRLFGPFMRRGVAVNLAAWRDERMSAAIFRDQCARAGLACISQELVSWEYGLYLLDCFSMFTRPGSRWDRDLSIVRNPMLVSEARRTKLLYAASSFR